MDYAYTQHFWTKTAPMILAFWIYTGFVFFWARSTFQCRLCAYHNRPKYVDDCSECGEVVEGSSGVVFDTFPASYPVKCIGCGLEQRSQLKSEVEMQRKQHENL